MKLNHPLVRRVIVPLGWLLVTMTAGAQSDALPLGYSTNISHVVYFDAPHEEQMKLRLTGSEAAPLPDAQYDLKNMKIERFSESGKLEAVAQAAQCIYAPLDGIVSSPGHVELTSGDGKFHASGDGFMWRQDDLSLVISNNVHTVIKTRGGILSNL